MGGMASRPFSDLFFYLLFAAQDLTLFSLSWCYSWSSGMFFWLWHQNNKQLGHCQCTGSEGPQRLDDTVQMTGSLHDFCLRAATECVSPEQMCSESPLLLHFTMSQKNLLRHELYCEDLLLWNMYISPWLGLIPTYLPQSYLHKQDSIFSCIIRISPFSALHLENASPSPRLSPLSCSLHVSYCHFRVRSTNPATGRVSAKQP